MGGAVWPNLRAATLPSTSIIDTLGSALTEQQQEESAVDGRMGPPHRLPEVPSRGDILHAIIPFYVFHI